MFCRNCRGKIEDIDFCADRSFATCPGCGALMSAEAADVAPAGMTVPRARVPLPEGFELDEQHRAARLRWRWRSRKTVPQLLTSVAVGVGFAGYLAWSSSPIELGCFQSFFVLVFGLVLYQALCQLVNRSVLEVGGGRITVRHGPLPLRFSRSLDAAQVEQFFCDEEPRRNSPRPSGLFRVRAALKGAPRAVDLVGALPDPQQALFLEQVIERALRIEDRATAGELPRLP
ncbi:MAG: hypothetical protein ACYC8T_07015 [Myxococcaceae bacterium]